MLYAIWKYVSWYLNIIDPSFTCQIIVEQLLFCIISLQINLAFYTYSKSIFHKSPWREPIRTCKKPAYICLCLTNRIECVLVFFFLFVWLSQLYLISSWAIFRFDNTDNVSILKIQNHNHNSKSKNQLLFLSYLQRVNFLNGAFLSVTFF